MAQPKVSVIIPVYNVEVYLRECLDSVLSQTLQDIEVICINDGSPDNSLAILNEYAANDARVKVIDKENEGVGKARNDGMAAATGEFIAFMDSDDYYPNDRVLEMMYRGAKENDVKITGGYYQKCRQNGAVENSKPAFEELTFQADGMTAYKDYQYDYGYTLFLFERTMLLDNHIVFPPYGRFQDPPFFVRAMIAAGEFYALDEPTYCYRILPMVAKYSVPKTLDMMKGLSDNLKVSKECDLAKLHYVTARRLDTEASFMVLQNVYTPDGEQLLAALLQTASLIDGEWLRENGFAWPEVFVPAAVQQLRQTAGQYEALRKTSLRKWLTWPMRKWFR